LNVDPVISVHNIKLFLQHSIPQDIVNPQVFENGDSFDVLPVAN
jgi:hypothetical protein